MSEEARGVWTICFQSLRSRRCGHGGRQKNFGEPTELSRLERGNPAMPADFRSVYHTVAVDWFDRHLADTPYVGHGRLLLFA